MKRYVKSSDHFKTLTSQCSFDFAHDGYYTYDDIDRIVNIACDEAGVDFIDSDYRSVDYSDYPEFKDAVVSQCSFDFEWNERYGYSAKIIKEALDRELAAINYELVGIDFQGI